MVPVTWGGKLFFMIFMCVGIPYFATMTALLSKSIHLYGESFIKRCTGSTEYYSLYYIMSGFVMLLLGPTVLFMYMEGTLYICL